LMPKLETLDPISGFKKLFGIRKLFDLLKNIAKVISIGILSFLMIRSALQPLVEQPSCGLRCAPAVLTGTMRPIFIMGSLFFLVIGLADIALQKWLFLRDQRMTKTEMKQETKNTEGDPVVKGQQKRMQREAAQAKIGMRQATFAISGSGIFVALRYNSADTRVPTLVARGEGDKASEMLQMARAQRLPISYDAETARAVFDQVRLGTTISKEMFQMVISVMKGLNIF
jgi:type III secretion protein U